VLSQAVRDFRLLCRRLENRSRLRSEHFDRLSVFSREALAGGQITEAHFRRVSCQRFLAIELSKGQSTGRAFAQARIPGGGEMQSQESYRCAPTYQSVAEFQASSHRTDFITVHTFGGRGSPSF
jgi:hypothetical protein